MEVVATPCGKKVARAGVGQNPKVYLFNKK